MIPSKIIDFQVHLPVDHLQGLATDARTLVATGITCL
jgi:hypothetical protein